VHQIDGTWLPMRQESGFTIGRRPDLATVV
jgi:hypothetical protein